MVAVVGPSGAGKSTLLRCINRLVEPSGGSISFQDKNINLIHGYELRKYRAQIGFIFQNYNLQKASYHQYVLQLKLPKLLTME